MEFSRIIQIGHSRRRSPLLLECLLCGDKFPESAVEKKEYFLATSVCKRCYVEGQKQNPKVWCFGKRQKRNSPGYAEGNLSCTRLCPDRAVCVSFINKLTEE